MCRHNGIRICRINLEFSSFEKTIYTWKYQSVVIQQNPCLYMANHGGEQKSGAVANKKGELWNAQQNQARKDLRIPV